jgi:hypothetical protein
MTTGDKYSRNLELKVQIEREGKAQASRYKVLQYL